MQKIWSALRRRALLAQPPWAVKSPRLKPTVPAEPFSVDHVIPSGRLVFVRSARVSMKIHGFAKAALSRRGILTGFAIALAVVPALPAFAGGDSAAKAFLDSIYQHYVGSSTGAAKGIPLTNVK